MNLVTAQYAECQTPPWTRNICYIALNSIPTSKCLRTPPNSTALPERCWDNFSTICHRNTIPVLPLYTSMMYTKITLPLLSLWFTFWHRSFTFNSNKSPTWCNSFSIYYPDVCLQLNMFRAFSRLSSGASRPSSGAQWLQWQPLLLLSYCGDSRAVFVVRLVMITSPTMSTAQLSPRYEGKTRGCHCNHWAPDDGRENARNMLRFK